MARPLLLLAALMATGTTVSAHPDDVVRLRVDVQPRELGFRFTLNLPCLARFCPLDSNGDGSVGGLELEAARPALALALQRHVRLEIDGAPADLGEITQLETLWPKGQSAPPHDSGRLVDLHFQARHPLAVADFCLAFDLFETLGPLARVEAEYVQEDMVLNVPFSFNARRYRHVTGYAAEAFFSQPAESVRTRTWLTAGLLLAGFVSLALQLARRRRS